MITLPFAIIAVLAYAFVGWWGLAGITAAFVIEVLLVCRRKVGKPKLRIVKEDE